MVNPKKPESQDWPSKETSKRLAKASDKTIENSNVEESFLDSTSDKRIKLACVRCRKRKTKCSGTTPCWTCSSGGYKCEFYKKPKKISVYDVEIQEYKDRIQRLEEELYSVRERPDKDTAEAIPISKIEHDPGSSKAASELSSSDKLNLSIWLGSASSELICWNLQQFKLSAMDKNKTAEEIIISPTFSSFHEETTYDYLLHMDYRAGSSDELDEYHMLTSLTYDKVLENLDNVVLFVNAGYLTIEPEDFKKQCKEYFDLDSSEKLFKPEYSNFKDEKRTYFLLKLLTLLALGDIYGKNSTTGEQNFDKHTCAVCQCDHSFNKKCPSIPGIQYFEMVIKFIPSSLVLSNITCFELEQTFEIIELFGLVSLYLRILDKKNAAVAFTVNALQLCISLNLHKERHLRTLIVNQMPSARIEKVWWGTFCLNRFFSSRISQPLLLSLDEIRRVDLNDVTEAPIGSPTKYDYSRLSSLRFYIELAKISDKVIRELYSPKVPFDNKEYLQSILNIVEKLVNWMNNLPAHLKLKLPMVIKENGEINRLICSLHLNYLHHIYLATIPVLLNIVKVKIVYYYRYKKLILSPLVLTDMPKNVSNIIHMLLNSCQLTINIFTTLYKQKYLRVFGITDLDFLFCSSLVFLISVILQINTTEFYSFEDYLAVSMNIMKQMWLGGNMIAKGKLSQLLNLLQDLEELLKELGNTKYLDILKSFEALRDPNKSCTGSRRPKFYKPEIKVMDDSLVSDELNPNSQPLPTLINSPGLGNHQLEHEMPSTQYPVDTTFNQNLKGLLETPIEESQHHDLAYPTVGIKDKTSQFIPSDYTFITNEEFHDYPYDELFPTSIHAADEDIEFMNSVLAEFFSDQF